MNSAIIVAVVALTAFVGLLFRSGVAKAYPFFAAYWIVWIVERVAFLLLREWAPALLPQAALGAEHLYFYLWAGCQVLEWALVFSIAVELQRVLVGRFRALERLSSLALRSIQAAATATLLLVILRPAQAGAAIQSISVAGEFVVYGAGTLLLVLVGLFGWFLQLRMPADWALPYRAALVTFAATWAVWSVRLGASPELGARYWHRITDIITFLVAGATAVAILRMAPEQAPEDAAQAPTNVVINRLEQLNGSIAKMVNS